MNWVDANSTLTAKQDRKVKVYGKLESWISDLRPYCLVVEWLKRWLIPRFYISLQRCTINIRHGYSRLCEVFIELIPRDPVSQESTMAEAMCQFQFESDLDESRDGLQSAVGDITRMSICTYTVWSK